MEQAKTIENIESRVEDIISRVTPGADLLRQKLIHNKELAQSQLAKLQLMATLDLSYQPQLAELLEIIKDIDNTLRVLGTPVAVVEEVCSELVDMETELQSLVKQDKYNGQVAFRIRALACYTQAVLASKPGNTEALRFLEKLNAMRVNASGLGDAGYSCVFNYTLNDNLKANEWIRLGKFYTEGGLAYDIAVWLKGRIIPFSLGGKVSGAFTREFTEALLTSLKARIRRISAEFVIHQMTGSDDLVRGLSERIIALVESAKVKVPKFPMPLSVEVAVHAERLPALYEEAQQLLLRSQPTLSLEEEQKTSLMHHMTLGKAGFLIDVVQRDTEYIESLRKALVLEKLVFMCVDDAKIDIISKQIGLADVIFEVPGSANLSYLVKKYIDIHKKLHISLPKDYDLSKIRNIVAGLYEQKLGVVKASTEASA